MNEVIFGQMGGVLLENADSGAENLEFSKVTRLEKNMPLCVLDGKIELYDVDRSDTFWEHYTYKSSKPLNHEDSDGSGKGIYSYNIICRRKNNRLYLLADTREIALYILDEEINPIFSYSLRRVLIKVDVLVRDLIRSNQYNSDSIYTLCYAAARVSNRNEFSGKDEDGEPLESFNFWGKDLIQSELFKTCTKSKSEKVRFHSCGLLSSSNGEEVIRISSNGCITFFNVDKGGLLVGHIALGFLRKNEYSNILVDRHQDEQLRPGSSADDI